MNVRSWILASRPKTYAASIAPVLVGTGLAYHISHDVPWVYAACALLGALSIQIATNFINDALDFKKGTDTHERLGPTRVTQAGLLDADAVMTGGYIALFIAAMFGIPLIIRGSWPIVAIGIGSIVAAYAYTGGPYPIAYHGLGEPFVLAFFGLIAVGGTFYVLTLQYSAEAFLCGLAMGSLAVVILAINNLRDIPGDRANNKRTIAVRLGEAGTRVEIVLFTAIAFVAIAMVAWLQHDRWLLAPLLATPLAIALVVRVYRSTGRELNRCLAMAGGLETLFSVLFLAASFV
ncbi:MAG TPA: 1,4-dihydroxy-2-naphthoate polyprenyltransferase [Thermoanaerobaculia bacterium]|nr:1,4-dihydroxy-2-naphthoate polyprenyltransferase [Thermoanaerobaculia bacterium]